MQFNGFLITPDRLTLLSLSCIRVSQTVTIPEASMKDIDEGAVKSFVRKALARQRISENAVEADTHTIFRNLKLISEQGELLSAALLLFGKEPDNYALSAFYKIGRGAWGRWVRPLHVRIAGGNPILVTTDTSKNGVRSSLQDNPIGKERL